MGPRSAKPGMSSEWNGAHGVTGVWRPPDDTSGGESGALGLYRRRRAATHGAGAEKRGMRMRRDPAEARNRIPSGGTAHLMILVACCQVGVGVRASAPQALETTT